MGATLDAGSIQTTYIVNIQKALENIQLVQAELGKSVGIIRESVTQATGAIEHLNSTPLGGSGFVDRTKSNFKSAGQAAIGFQKQVVGALSTIRGAVDDLAGQISVLQGLLGTIGLAGLFEIEKEFDRAVVNLRTEMGKTEKEFANTRAEIVRFAGEIKTTALAVAESLERVDKAGFDLAQGFDIIRAATLGAKATLGDVVATSDTLARVLRGFNIPVGDAARVMDQLRVAGATARIDMDQLGLAVSKLGPQARLSGISFTELLQILTVIVRSGGNAETSINQIRQAMAGLRKPSKEAAEEIQKLLGVSAQASIANIGFANTLRLLIERTGGTADALTKVFPSLREFDGLAALATASGAQMDEVFGRIASGSATALAQAAKSQAESISGLIKAIGRLLIQPVVQYFESIRTTIVASLTAVRDFVKDHQALVGTLVAVTVGITGTVAGLVVLKGVLTATSTAVNLLIKGQELLVTGLSGIATAVTSTTGTLARLKETVDGVFAAGKTGGLIGFFSASVTGAREAAAAEAVLTAATQANTIATAEEVVALEAKLAAQTAVNAATVQGAATTTLATAASTSAFAKLLPNLAALAGGLKNMVAGAGGLVGAIGSVGRAVLVAGGAALLFVGKMALILGAITAVGAAAFWAGRQIKYLLSPDSRPFTEEEKRVNAMAEAYTEFADKVDKARHSVDEITADPKKLTGLYQELTEQTIRLAQGHTEVKDRVIELRREIARLGGETQVSARLAKEIANARSTFDAGRVAETKGRGLSGSGAFKKFDQSAIDAALGSGNEDRIANAKKLLAELALAAGVTKDKLDETVNNYVALVQQQAALNKALVESTKSQKGLSFDMANLSDNLAGVVSAYKDLGDEMDRIVDDLSTLDDAAKGKQNLEKLFDKLKKKYAELENARAGALKTVGGDAGKFTPDQLADYNAILALQDKLVAAADAINARLTKNESDSKERRAKQQADLQAQIEAGEIRALERQGKFREAAEREAKLTFDKQIAAINEIKAAEGESADQVEAKKKILRTQADADYQAEKSRVGDIAQKKFEATEAGEKQRQEHEKRKQQDQRLEELAVLQGQIAEAAKLRDLRTEAGLRQRLVGLLHEIGDIEAENAAKDADITRSTQKRLGLLQQELDTQFRLQGKGGNFSDTIRRAQSDLAGASDPLAFRGALQGKLSQVNTVETARALGSAIRNTLGLEFQAAGIARDQAVGRRDKNAADEAYRAQLETIEKNRILVEEVEAAIAEIKARASNPRANESAGGAKLPLPTTGGAAAPLPANNGELANTQGFKDRFFKRGNGFFDRTTKDQGLSIDEARRRLSGGAEPTPLADLFGGPGTPGTNVSNAVAGPGGIGTPGQTDQSIANAISGAVTATETLSVSLADQSKAVTDGFGVIKTRFEQVVVQVNANTKQVNAITDDIKRLKIEGRSQ